MFLNDARMKFFDAHLHIIDPQYPLVENEGYLPPDFTVEDYLNRVKDLNVAGGVVVSASFQASDYGYLIAALEKLGDHFVGVANIPPDTSEISLKRLDEADVVAIRHNIVRDGSDQVDNLIELSNRVYANFGWHSEFYLRNRSLKDMRDIFQAIPAYSIDHLGLTKEGLDELYKLVEKGARVKASGFGRVNFDVIEVMQKIHSINPRALIFGTDLPSTRAKIPFYERDVALIKQHFSEEEQKKIFFENGWQWYMER